MTSKRRVLAIMHDAAPTGAPRAFQATLPAFAHVDLTVLIKHDGPLAREIEQTGVKVLVEPHELKVLRRLRSKSGRARSDAAGGGRAYRAARRGLVHLEEQVARRMLRTERPDLVYANSLASSEYATEAIKLGIPSVLHSHEIGDRMKHLLRRSALRPQKNLILVSCSRAAAQELASILGVEVERIRIIPNGVDADTLRRETERVGKASTPLVVGLGTAAHWKGADLFTEVAVRVTAKRDARFRWIGDGPMLEELRASVGRLGMGDRIEFTGYSLNPWAEVAPGHLMLAPSREESFGLAVAEAMAMGMPIVTTNVGGLPEVVGDCGFIAAADDVAGLVEATKYFLDNPAEAVRVGRRAEERVRILFSPQKVQELTRELIDRSLNSTT